MTTQSYSVTGLTCGHCAHAVKQEVSALSGVTEVEVDLVPHGTSTLAVTSASPLENAALEAALDEAGDYHLVS